MAQQAGHGEAAVGYYRSDALFLRPVRGTLEFSLASIINQYGISDRRSGKKRTVKREAELATQSQILEEQISSGFHNGCGQPL